MNKNSAAKWCLCVASVTWQEIEVKLCLIVLFLCFINDECEVAIPPQSLSLIAQQNRSTNHTLAQGTNWTIQSWFCCCNSDYLVRKSDFGMLSSFLLHITKSMFYSEDSTVWTEPLHIPKVPNMTGVTLCSCSFELNMPWLFFIFMQILINLLKREAIKTEQNRF